MGVLIPLSPASGVPGARFFPFEESWYWGEWKRRAVAYMWTTGSTFSRT